MGNKILYIIRGVSGSGKSTLAKALIGDRDYKLHVMEADQFFYDKHDNYNFDPSKLGKAHENCQHRVGVSMEFGVYPIVVSNTSTTEKELKSYLDLAKEHGYAVFCLVVENRHGNSDVHNVPSEVKQKQERNLRNSLKLS